MINIVDGNILNCKEDIIVHQVNCQGIMGGGLAKQIANVFPKVNSEYQLFCKIHLNKYELLRKRVYLVQENGKYIANMFSQKPNFDTDYEAMEVALKDILEYAKTRRLTIAIPFKIRMWYCKSENGN